MANGKAEIGSARPETVPVLVRAAGEKGTGPRRAGGNAPTTIVAGMDAAEALNTGKRRNYKRVQRKR